MSETRCSVEHVGIVVSGCVNAEMDDGTVTEMLPGDIFYIPPGHDSWVVGTDPYVSLHRLGAGEYTKNY
jgi:quercetin dioxygenase-like cupin family protein